MSDILTDADLAEIERRAEAATKGPWRAYTVQTGEFAGEFGVISDASHIAKPDNPDDAAFVAHARTDIPRLLKEIARLRGIEERAKKIVSDYDVGWAYTRELNISDFRHLLEGDDDPDVLGNAADTL